MSRYAWLACTDCKVMLWLGKAVCSDQNNRAQHTFRVVTDQDPEYKALEEYVEIGGDEDRDMAFETHLKGWPG